MVRKSRMERIVRAGTIAYGPGPDMDLPSGKGPEAIPATVRESLRVLSLRTFMWTRDGSSRVRRTPHDAAPGP